MKPMLFSTDMVRAILEGRKTVTRRVVKPQPYSVPLEGGVTAIYGADSQPYHPGDILYVRETWAAWSRADGIAPKLYYKADGDTRDSFNWRPSIHMPREAARLFLRVTNVRVERLQDITEDGIRAEGVQSKKPAWLRLDFADLWHVSLGPKDPAVYGWNANPWVWVIEFERISREEAGA